MTDSDRLEAIRGLLQSKLNPAAKVEAIGKIVLEPQAVPAIPEQHVKLSVVPVKTQEQPSVDGQRHDRLLTLEEVCARAGYCPNTVHSYRARSLSHKLKLPPLIKRGDGRLGCLESVLESFLAVQHGEQK